MANGTTIRYTGTEQEVIDAYNSSTPSPLWLQEDPRGTGTPQWFAVVNNSSSAQITAYAKSTGSAASAYFTKSGQPGPVPFNNIVTTYMTSMVQLFIGASQFNKNISDWDTSNVSHSSGMGQMFQNANMFDQDISKWNVANVKHMGQMFFYASKFNSDISGWNTSNVVSMNFMFYEATLFNRNLSGWNVGKITSDFRINFANGSPLALLANVALQPIWPKLYFNGVTIQYTDSTAQAIADAYNLPTPSPLWLQEDPRGTGTPQWFAVVNNSSTAQIKAYATSTGSAVSAYFTKSGQPGPVPFNNIVTTYMTNMSQVFQYNTTFNEDISSWDTLNVIWMIQMFEQAHVFNKDISGWDTRNVINMHGMFYGATLFNRNLSGWNVGKVTNMTEMFRYATAFNQNLSGWNVGKVTSRDNFASPALLETVTLQPNNWPKLSRLANGKTIRYTGDTFTSPLFILEDPRNTGTPEWFAVVAGTDATDIGTDVNLPIRNYAKSTNSAVSTYFTPPGQSGPVKFNNIVTTRVFRGYLSKVFADAYTFNEDISSWDLSNTTNTSLMFYNARAFDQDISNWDMSNVENMSYMFHGTQAFNRDIGVWNVGKVSYMDGVFRYATAFNKNLSGWNVARSGISRNDFALGSQLALLENSGKLPPFQ